MTSKNFLQEKKFLNYYKGHYLESVAKLFVGKVHINDTEKLFRYSKNVTNNRDRKKLLKTIYHGIKNQHIFFERDRMSLMLVHNRISVSAFNALIKDNSWENIDYFDHINKHASPDVKITRIKDLKEIAKDLQFDFKFPASLKNIKNLNGYDIDIIENSHELKKAASVYQNCWTTHAHECSTGEFYLFNVKDKENNEQLGTIRFHTLKEKLNVAGWIMPKGSDPEFLYWQFSKKLLKSFMKDLYLQTGDETFNAKNIELELHYGDKRGKYTDSLENKYTTGTIKSKVKITI
jgi:hypothetical protein